MFVNNLSHDLSIFSNMTGVYCLVQSDPQFKHRYISSSISLKFCIFIITPALLPPTGAYLTEL